MKRRAKAMQEKASQCVVQPVGDGQWLVDSPSGHTYRVFEMADGTFRCVGNDPAHPCTWSLYNKYDPCSHRLAVEQWLEESGNRRLSFWREEDEAKRQKRPMRNVGTRYPLYATSRPLGRDTARTAAKAAPKINRIFTEGAVEI